MGFSIGKISLGSAAHKRYSHNLSFDNNTTFDFGSVQPLMCQFMMQNSDIKASYKQLVRLAPMVVPSFARMHMQNEVSFVPLAEVVPYYEAMIARLPYSVGAGAKTYKPTSLPYTDNAFLVYWLLVGNHCKYSYWTRLASSDDGKSMTYIPMEITSSNVKVVQSKLRTVLFGSDTVLSPDLSASDSLYSAELDAESAEFVTFEGADFVLKLDETNAITFRLNGAAKRVRKILIGLGYSLNMNDKTPVSFAPILAFYKAWYDLYAVRRTSSWTNTDCFAIIKYIEDNYHIDFTAKGFKSDNVVLFALFNNFMTALRNCWYVYKDDFVSVHRVTPQLVGRSAQYVNGMSVVDSVSNDALSSGNYGDPYIKPTNTSPNPFISLTNVGLQTIQRLSRFVNKDSVIAQRMSEWLRVHYGADVVNSVFKDVNHVSSSRLDLEVNDVMSTSDTAQGQGDNRSGEVLGAYAGKGVGFNKNGFKFHANTAGFIIVMSSIVPEGGFWQGNDTSLYAINNDTLPNPDFDALGMELTPKGAIASDNNIYVSGLSDDLTDKAFGFVPRYTGFKVKKNIVNGDMSRRGTISSLSPYYLDRILTSTVVVGDNIKKRTEHTVPQDYVYFDCEALPVASEKWRYCAAYPWLGDYNRLFYQSGELYKGGSIERMQGDFGGFVDDNFLCQCVFDVRVTNFLKPISDSYDTYEESTDKGTVDVHAE